MVTSRDACNEFSGQDRTQRWRFFVNFSENLNTAYSVPAHADIEFHGMRSHPVTVSYTQGLKALILTNPLAAE